MKVGFITTIDTNIGDDFIRTGIQHIVEEAFKGQKIEYVLVNKHKPYTAYPSWHPLRYVPDLARVKGGGRAGRLMARILSKLGGSKYDSCDLIIQSGAPVLWPNCEQCEWNVPIWQQIVGRLHKRIPVFNIAAGSCYPWTQQPPGSFINPREKEYAETIGSYCQLTTTRDELANALFNSVGRSNILKPCTAFFVDPRLDNSNKGEYILINYMKGGGHFSWDQEINNQAWEATMKEVISELKKDHEVRFICHDEKEAQLAKELDPSLKIHLPKTVGEYVACVRNAIVGINNRMHASVAMGSSGVPAISICTDTRLLMLKNIGLPNFYVKDVTSASLLSTVRQLIGNVDAERKRLSDLKKKSFSEYKQLFTDSYVPR